MTLQINTPSGARDLTSEEQVAARAGLAAAAAADLSAHVSSTSNPHGITKAQVGLGSVDNTADADKPVSVAQAAAIAAVVGVTNLSATASPTGVTVGSDTGADAVLPLADGTNAGLMAPAQFAKLAGIAAGATANATDAQLRDRSTHTGTQATSTVAGLDAALAGKATAAQGAKADTAVQPGAQLTQAAVTAATAAGVALLGAADAPAQRAALGLGTAATTPATNYATAAQGAKADASYDAPYVITGRANIRNPAFNAPIANAEDPAAAAANSAAIQAMLNGGYRSIELDDRARRINTTLLVPGQTDVTTGLRIIGPGRSAPSLIWTGGDAPIIARHNYTDANVLGSHNVVLQDMRIEDQLAARVNTWSIDLSNGNSCEIKNVHLKAVAGSAASNKYGVFLGKAIGSTWTGNHFLAKIEDSRFENCRVYINTTDWYGLNSEFWGQYRDDALVIAGGGFIGNGTQIVPGSNSGIRLAATLGTTVIDTLRVVGVYFDGSYTSLNTGWAILASESAQLVGAEIIGNSFWHMNAGGVNLGTFSNSKLASNVFRDNDSDDTGDADIIIADLAGSVVDNEHYRATTAPKTGSARANNGRPFILTGRTGNALSKAGGVVGGYSGYLDSQITNSDRIIDIGGSFRHRYTRTMSTLPTWEWKHEIAVDADGTPHFCDGTDWTPMNGNAVVVSTGSDLNNRIASGAFWLPNIIDNANYPAGFYGSGLLRVQKAATGYVYQELVMFATGARKFRTQQGGTWGAWA